MTATDIRCTGCGARLRLQGRAGPPLPALDPCPRCGSSLDRAPVLYHRAHRVRAVPRAAGLAGAAGHPAAAVAEPPLPAAAPEAAAGPAPDVPFPLPVAEDAAPPPAEAGIPAAPPPVEAEAASPGTESLDEAAPSPEEPSADPSATVLIPRQEIPSAEAAAQQQESLFDESTEEVVAEAEAAWDQPVAPEPVEPPPPAGSPAAFSEQAPPTTDEGAEDTGESLPAAPPAEEAPSRPLDRSGFFGRGALAGSLLGILSGAVYLLVFAGLDWTLGSPAAMLRQIGRPEALIALSLVPVGALCGLLVSLLTRPRSPR